MPYLTVDTKRPEPTAPVNIPAPQTPRNNNTQGTFHMNSPLASPFSSMFADLFDKNSIQHDDEPVAEQGRNSLVYPGMLPFMPDDNQTTPKSAGNAGPFTTLFRRHHTDIEDAPAPRTSGFLSTSAPAAANTWLRQGEEKVVGYFRRSLTPVEEMILEGGFTS